MAKNASGLSLLMALGAGGAPQGGASAIDAILGLAAPAAVAPDILPSQIGPAGRGVKTAPETPPLDFQTLRGMTGGGPFGDFLARQVMTESSGIRMADSPKGAKGLAQFMPETWKRIITPKDKHFINSKGEKVKGFGAVPEGSSPYNVDAALKGQRFYMEWLQKRPEITNLRRAAAAYNAGHGKVRQLVEKHGDKWEDHLPTETKNYLKRLFD